METEREAFALEKDEAHERQREGPHVCAWICNVWVKRQSEMLLFLNKY